MKKYSLRLYFFNLGRKFCWCLEATNFKIFPTIVGQFTKDRTFNILGKMEVQQGQELLLNYIFKNRSEKVDCLVSVEQFSDFQFLLQQVLHIQDHPLQKSISDGVYFSNVASLHCTYCSSMIYRLYHMYRLYNIYFWSMFRKLAVFKRIFLEKSLWCTSG